MNKWQLIWLLIAVASMIMLALGADTTAFVAGAIIMSKLYEDHE